MTLHDGDGLTQAICQALSEKIGALTGLERRYIRSGLITNFCGCRFKYDVHPCETDRFFYRARPYRV